MRLVQLDPDRRHRRGRPGQRLDQRRLAAQRGAAASQAGQRPLTVDAPAPNAAPAGRGQPRRPVGGEHARGSAAHRRRRRRAAAAATSPGRPRGSSRRRGRSPGPPPAPRPAPRPAVPPRPPPRRPAPGRAGRPGRPASSRPARPRPARPRRRPPRPAEVRGGMRRRGRGRPGGPRPGAGRAGRPARRPPPRPSIAPQLNRSTATSCSSGQVCTDRCDSASTSTSVTAPLGKTTAVSSSTCPPPVADRGPGGGGETASGSVVRSGSPAAPSTA